MSKAQCDGECTPDLSVYHSKCPLHGAALLRRMLGGDDVQDEEDAERRGGDGSERSEGP